MKKMSMQDQMFFGDAPTELFEKCASGSPDDVRAAIANGCDVNARSERGNTPLIWASVMNKNHLVIDTLIESGADVNAANERGFTALMLAAKRNSSLDVKRSLIDAGADLQARNAWDDSVLTLAANPWFRRNVLEAVILFIDKGADVNARNSRNDSPLDEALFCPSPNLDVLIVLLAAGVNINEQDSEGKTSLMKAARYDTNPLIINLLLSAGADPRIRDHHGRTAIDEIGPRRALRNSNAFVRLQEAS